MLQDSILVEQRYHKFIQQVCETQIVFALKGKGGFAYSISNKIETETEEDVDLLCFWSEKSLAGACQKKEWKDYTLESIDLACFIENWCFGMQKDGLLAGINFDWNLFGFEIEPLKLALELIERIKLNNIEIHFVKYEHIDEIEKEIRDVLSL